MAQYVNIVYFNVRGLGDASKRHAIFTYLRQFQPAIICLSETHLLKDKTHLIHKPWVGHAYYLIFSSHAMGVAVLVYNQIPFHFFNSVVYTEGRYVCLLCPVYNITIVLVVLYIPPPYSREIVKKVLAFLDASPCGYPCCF